jgi:GNAT superfamily N-acetyltransferase
LILRFVRGIAEYERLGHAVAATEETLSEWLFDKNAAEVVFALVEGEEVGFAVFFANFSTFVGKAGMYLEDIYVLPEHRGRGVGKAMLRELVRIAGERGYGRIELACLDWNAPSIAFYRSFGFEPVDGWTIYRLPMDDE